MLRTHWADFLLYVDHEGLAPGVEGWWDDGVAVARPWGFELSGWL